MVFGVQKFWPHRFPKPSLTPVAHDFAFPPIDHAFAD